jgi:hypothetical protein
MKALLGLLFLLHVAVVASAQRVCASETYSQKLLSANSSIKNDWSKAEAQIASTLKAALSSVARDTAANEVINIPVVIHVVYNKAIENISDAQVQAQLIALNNDYSNSNRDRINTPAVFASLTADVKIKFCLAQVDPQGRRTSGIVRKYTVKDYFSPEDGMKISAQGGDDAWDNKRYLNIWVCNMSGRTLGYSSLPGGPATVDGVVIAYDVFGAGENVRSPFNKGRTTTHEIGHWLGLKHIWGDAVCGTDLVDDTPTQQYYNYGCPTFPHVTNCSPNGNGDMFMNFMDFTDDGCMNMFTNGQKQRMRALFAKGNMRNSFLLSFACDSTLAQGSSLPVTVDTIPATTTVTPIVPAKQNISLKVYPNPTQSIVNIEYTNTITSSPKTISIFSVVGTRVYTDKLTKEKAYVNIANFSKGVYIVQIEEGTNRLTTKIIKQ